MTALADLRVDGDRLWASLMAMAEIGATPGGGRQTVRGIWTPKTSLLVN
jgi:hypothetical protein